MGGKGIRGSRLPRLNDSNQMLALSRANRSQRSFALANPFRNGMGLLSHHGLDRALRLDALLLVLLAHNDRALECLEQVPDFVLDRVG